MAVAPTRLGYVYTATGQSDTAITVTPGGTIAIGHWMILVLTMLTTTTVTPPAGWTTLQTATSAGTLKVGIYGKLRASGDAGYTVAVSTGGGTTSAALMWGAGARAVSTWQVGAAGYRTVDKTNTAPSVTTVGNHGLALIVSTERTTTTEAAVTSLTGATEWFFGAQSGSMLQTTHLSYIADVAPAGATPAVTIVYPNTQTTNGMARQIILPAIPDAMLWLNYTEVPCQTTKWTGTVEVPLTGFTVSGASAPTRYSIFATATPGTGGTVYTDGGTTLAMGNRFYTTKAIQIVGARVWNPVGSDSTFLSTDLTVTAYTNDWTGTAVNYADTVAGAVRQTKTHTATRTAGTWTDVVFDSAFTLPPIAAGATGADLLTLRLQFAGGTYYVVALLPNDAAVDAPGSTGTYLAEEVGIGRGVNSIAGSPVPTFYGIDVLFEVV